MNTEHKLLKLITDASRISTHAAELLRIIQEASGARPLNLNNIEWYMGSISERLAGIKMSWYMIPEAEELYKEYSKSKSTKEDV